jgi:hypothetical protein
MLVIHILYDAALFQVSGSQAPRQGTVLFPQPLLIDDQRKAFLEAQLAGFSSFQLSTEGIRESVQFHSMKFLDGLLVVLAQTSAKNRRGRAPLHTPNYLLFSISLTRATNSAGANGRGKIRKPSLVINKRGPDAVHFGQSRLATLNRSDLVFVPDRN